MERKEEEVWGVLQKTEKKRQQILSLRMEHNSSVDQQNVQHEPTDEKFNNWLWISKTMK